MKVAFQRIWQKLFVRKFKTFEIDYLTGKITNQLVAEDFAKRVLQKQNDWRFFSAM